MKRVILGRRVILGPHGVEEAVRARPGALTVVYVDERARKTLRVLSEEIRARGVKLEERSRAELDALARGGSHQGVLGIAGEFQYSELEEVLEGCDARALVVALDEITDPHNLGAIVRSAVAFGAAAVITLKDRAAPVTPVVVRASAGTTEHARIARVTNLARTLASLRDEHDFEVLGLAADGELDVAALEAPTRPRAIVIGSEGRGLRPLVRQQCTSTVRIAMSGPVGSLNASVAAGIALFALSSATQKG